MNVWKRRAAAILAAAVLSGAAPAAAETFSPETDAAAVVEAFVEEQKLDPARISVGYYNTVTGEEAYFNGERELYPASMYKVALCMYWAEKVYEGELSWDDRVNKAVLGPQVQAAIEVSDNQWAENLLVAVSKSFKEFRKIMAPFYGMDAENLPGNYLRHGWITPKNMIFNLRVLYENAERYPRILDHMKNANPGEYFLKDEHPWEIAHKYGYYEEGGVIVNDCAVVYTENPFLLVVMTKSLTEPQETMSALLQRLGEYTEFDARRRAPVSTPTPSPRPTATPAPTVAPTATAEPTPAPMPEPEPSAEGWRTAAILFGAAFLGALSLPLLLRRKRR